MEEQALADFLGELGLAYKDLNDESNRLREQFDRFERAKSKFENLFSRIPKDAAPQLLNYQQAALPLPAPSVSVEHEHVKNTVSGVSERSAEPAAKDARNNCSLEDLHGPVRPAIPVSPIIHAPSQTHDAGVDDEFHDAMEVPESPLIDPHPLNMDIDQGHHAAHGDRADEGHEPHHLQQEDAERQQAMHIEDACDAEGLDPPASPNQFGHGALPDAERMEQPSSMEGGHGADAVQKAAPSSNTAATDDELENNSSCFVRRKQGD